MRRQKTKVLAVDQDPLCLQLLTRYLQLQGYEVYAAGDGQQAIEQVALHAPSLVFLDAALPLQPDAFTVCQRIHRDVYSVIIGILILAGLIMLMLTIVNPIR